MNKLVRQLSTSLVVLLLSAAAMGQTQKVVDTGNVSSTSTRQSILSSLSALPEADTIFYLDPQRILNDVVPKLLPEAQVTKMRQQFKDLKQFAGVDPSSIDYMVVAVRFRRPPADLTFQAPEFLIVTTGDFSAESLLTLARLGLQGKLRDEKYGSRTLGIISVDELAPETPKVPFLKRMLEVGLVALNNNTIAAGNINYIKAAADAADGRERIKEQTLKSLLQDPNALVSIAGSPWSSFAKAFGLMGTEGNARPARCESKLGDYFASVTMEGTDFKIRGAMNADNPDTAKIIYSLISGLLQTAATAASGDKNAEAAMKLFRISPDEAELRLEADIPQQIVLDYIREQMKPKPTTSVKTETPATKPARKPRRKIKRS